jgi:hypothetical protein
VRYRCPRKGGDGTSPEQTICKRKDEHNDCARAPIKVGEDTIGAVGVSGAPGRDKDEACAKAGIDKIAADLK